VGWCFFGDLATPGTFGHNGATGTVAWVDPARELICILFTTEPNALELGRGRGLMKDIHAREDKGQTTGDHNAKPI
jgi:CubicO group peptidase (beta-lactamase class C family)